MTALGTSRTSRDIRLESAKCAKADIDQVAVTNRYFMSTRPSNANVAALLTISCSSCTHVDPTSRVNVVVPVRLPPGRFRLARGALAGDERTRGSLALPAF